MSKLALNIVETPEGMRTVRADGVGLPDMMASSDRSEKTQPAKGMTLGKIPRELHEGYEWAPWGRYDNEPTRIRKQLAKVPLAGRVLKDKAKALWGNGLVYYKREDLRKEKANAQPAYIPAIEDFLEENMLGTKWLLPQFMDYVQNYNSFSELIMNRRKDYITNIRHQTAEFCRVGKQNPRNLRFEHIHFSPDFSIGYQPTKDRVKKVPLATWFDRRGFFDRLRGFNFFYHSRITAPGTIYYPEPFWKSLIEKDGWIEAVAEVPKIIAAMQRNQISIKYQILIPVSYFTIRYPDWHSYTGEQREVKIKDLQKKIDDTLTGSKNAYRSLLTVFSDDPAFSTPQGKPEILPIDDKLKQDSWVPTTQQGDQQIVQGLGGHASNVGLGGGDSKMGAGSGSNIRELFNVEVDTNTPEQLCILEVLELVSWFNRQKYAADWDVIFRVDHNRHTTKDKNEFGRDESKNQPGNKPNKKEDDEE